ncbi:MULTISPECIES: hypothetical protein [unclassified Bradyrhizobium]|uniref:hypothetical protein n=1 Tax=unclassified Bradyrhizobium TaxID=2631580 RepID=UPI001FFA5F4A|nr:MULTISPECIES: hypothetical protein [unclassified Bradyrhizobium]MCK1453165.1 hypothetical protein [Bradyrhizobium sp. 35]MCK1764012.1 hypothetical protein [Bradyrhizobium sp. 136]
MRAFRRELAIGLSLRLQLGFEGRIRLVCRKRFKLNRARKGGIHVGKLGHVGCKPKISAKVS